MGTFTSGGRSDDNPCWHGYTHAAMTLEENYVRGTAALVQSILTNAACPDNVFLHLMTHDNNNNNDDDDDDKRRVDKNRENIGGGGGSDGDDGGGGGGGTARALSTLTSLFPDVRLAIHDMSRFNITSGRVVRADMRYRGGDLEAPLNYARAWLPHALPRCVARVAVIDTDVIVLDRVESLFRVDMGPDHPPGQRVGAVIIKQNNGGGGVGGGGERGAAVAAAEWCQHRVEEYFTDHFWKSDMSKSVGGVKNACYFNPGVMVVDTARWRANGHTQQLESWMRAQASAPVGQRLYRLGSLPPFLLVFAGHLARPGLSDDPSWNVHDLGCGCGTRVEPATVKAMHWSCGGKPWRRLDAEAAYISARRAEVMNGNGDGDGDTKTKPPPLSMRPCAVDRYFWKPYDVLGMSSSSAAAARQPRWGPTFLPGDTVGGFGGGLGTTLWGGRDAESEQRERDEEEERERKAFEWEEEKDDDEEKNENEKEKEKEKADEEEDEEKKKEEDEEDNQATDRGSREGGAGGTTVMDLFAAAEEAEEE